MNPHLKLILEVLGIINAGGRQQEIYPLLENNLHLLDTNLIQAIERFAYDNISSTNKKQSETIGYNLWKFAELILQFRSKTFANNIEISISSYKIALVIFNKSDFPYDWASIKNDLGIAYRLRTKGSKSENLEQAVEHYNNSLKIRTLSDYPLDSAATQVNLANVYFELKNHRADNLEQAIQLYRNALSVVNEVDNPIRFAGIQNNLANVFKNRIKGNKADNLEQAILHCKRALNVYMMYFSLKDWAITQINLGITYAQRIKGDKAENIENAIQCCKGALTILHETDFPVDWAKLQLNLATIYLRRISGDKAKNIEYGIQCCKNALRIHGKQDFPIEWSNNQHNLANLYLHRIYGDEAENLEQAILHFKNALNVQTKTNFPLYWAGTHNNLAITYKSRIRGSKIENIEQAILHSEKALEIYTEVNYPFYWATAQNTLANCYWERIKGEKKHNLEKAIYLYRLALKVHVKDLFPFECFRTNKNLGDLAYENMNWRLSINAYSQSIEGLETFREWAINDDRKQEIISNAIEVYQNIVQACINLEQIDKAIEYVERGKARNLVDLLATRDLYPKGDIPQEVKDRLDSLRQEAIAEEKRLSQQRDRRNGFGGFSTGDNRGLESVVGNDEAINRDRLNNIRQELDNLVKKDILPVDPSFQLTQKVEPISFDKIRASLPSNKTVLIEWFVGKETLSVFIVAAHMEQPLLISYSAEEYQVLFDLFGRYLDTYQQRDRQWHNQLDDLLVELAQSLKIESIIEQIEKLIPDCNRLILVPHRWLHLLPIHALPLPDDKCLLDLYPQGVSYAPSVQLLELTQKQSKPELNNLFAVQNPTKDLKFTDVEVQAVRSQFQPNDDVLTKQQATKSALNKERLGQANAAHFSCHGYFNFENPELSALLLAGSKVEKNQEGEDKSETRFLPSRDGGSIDLEHCLTLGEIFSLDLRNCRLVTLSACETGLTDFKSLSDEYIGLPSGFLYAGSPSVVSSLWAVNDISTSFLMIKFYQNLQEIDSVAIALNQAQLWLRSVTKGELYAWGETLPLPIYERIPYFDAALQKLAPNTIPYASPYFWGAFCAVGS